MDSFHEFYDSGNGFQFGAQNPNLVTGIGFGDGDRPDNSGQSSSSGSYLEGSSLSDDGDYSDSVFRFINQMLMEEDMEEKPCMFHDPLALQAAEKSFYEVLVDDYPPNRTPESPYDHFSSISFSDSNGNSSSTYSSSNSVDFGEKKPSLFDSPLPSNFFFQSVSNNSNTRSSFKLSPTSSVTSIESVFQFNRGVEEASKFLPSPNHLMLDLESNSFAPMMKEKKTSKVVVKQEKVERVYSPPDGLRGKKNHEREDVVFEEERSNKQSAVYVEETELSDMFDRVLLCAPVKGEHDRCSDKEVLQIGASKSLQQSGQSERSNGGKGSGKKPGSKKGVVDLETLLVLCAQAVSADDRMTANEHLKKIRQHSSPFGERTPRLAHYIANSLEARLAGTGTQIYTALDPKRTAADTLKAYQVHMSSCPFKKLAIIFANHMIISMAEKATTLHIIDFGILYGFQWPALIHCLSNRSSGPIKLRITGIELPQPGFRPAERVQETGCRLAKYCERFNIPFEYKAIAQKWETIQVEDLEINKNEVLAVNCIFRFENLLDETVVVNSPRNAVLNLIRKANPDIFVHAIANGSYNAPFFVTRFREALFHYSALFDILDVNLSHENQMRLIFEKEFYGREAVNVIACEGPERVVRPETYKQWQARNKRAGFRQLPLDRELMKKLASKLLGYHKDFVIDEDGCWMLQGWKGRILNASSVWVPA